MALVLGDYGGYKPLISDAEQSQTPTFCDHFPHSLETHKQLYWTGIMSFIILLSSGAVGCNSHRLWWD